MGVQRHSIALSELLRGIHHVPAALDTQLHGICSDSRMVKQGDLFIALSGANSAATEYIEKAIANGAVAIVAEGGKPTERVHEDGAAIELFIPDLRARLGDIAARFFQNASDVLSVIGVTGTNGKTSVANFISSFFEKVGKKAGVVGTLGYGFPAFGLEHLRETAHTTPDVVNMHRYLSWLRDEGAEYAAIEVSSHGLSQGRVDGVHFEAAIFTNLTREHLDYHGSMEEYAAAKRKLFERQELSLAVINADDEYADFMKQAVSKKTDVLTFSLSNKGAVSVKSVSYSLSGIEAEIDTPLGSFSLSSGLVGEFNLSNLLAIVALAIGMNIRLEKIAQAVNSIAAINGRMQKLEKPNQCTVIIDYAHTPDALKSILTSLKSYCRGNLYLVFGCGGDRDQGKRPEMAAIAEQNADHIVVTDDNPRFENPSQIIDQILSGFSDEQKVVVERDRERAIASAIQKASENDLVVVAGKGHETYQDIAGERKRFSDVEVAQKALGIDVSAPVEQEGVGCD